MYKIIIFLINLSSITLQQEIIQLRDAHREKELNVRQLRALSQHSTSYMNEILNNIAVPRVVGTVSHENVFNYIKSELEQLNWHVEVDEFKQRAPKFGQLTFKNLVGTLNPNADRFLVLACHYDSKYFKGQEFIGASDSAVPCAMMLNLIKVLKDELDTKRDDNSLSLKLLFLDGEEAFVHWGPDDSIYGAKHLANKMSQSDLEKIDMFILLDLLGLPNPRFYSFFRNTYKWYSRLHNIENKLQTMKLLKNNNGLRYFNDLETYANIEDDHVPFLRKGVPILHVIPVPFPDVWHTVNDNMNAIDMETTENLNKILRVFVAEYLHLSITDTDEREDEEEEKEDVEHREEL